MMAGLLNTELKTLAADERYWEETNKRKKKHRQNHPNNNKTFQHSGWEKLISLRHSVISSLVFSLETGICQIQT